MNAGLVPDNRSESRRESSEKNRRLPPAFGKGQVPWGRRSACLGKIAAACVKPKNRRYAYIYNKYLCNIHTYPNETITNDKKYDKTN